MICSSLSLLRHAVRIVGHPSTSPYQSWFSCQRSTERPDTLGTADILSQRSGWFNRNKPRSLMSRLILQRTIVVQGSRKWVGCWRIFVRFLFYCTWFIVPYTDFLEAVLIFGGWYMKMSEVVVGRDELYLTQTQAVQAHDFSYTLQNLLQTFYEF